MFEAAGLSVHVYTSPHLVRFAERIRVGGRLISEDALSAVLDDCERANAGEPITFFEITTAAAFLAFAREPADVTLLEVGLGGRLDATNVVDRPAVTVITPISMDHQHYLGRRLRDIAAEKAGILKPRVPAVIGPQHAIAGRVVAGAAGTLGAPILRWAEGFRGTRRDADGALLYGADGRTTAFPAPALAGPHQYANGAIAIAAAKTFGDTSVDDAAIGRGLKRAVWPARLQRLARGRLAGPLAGRGFEIWVDGGHNPQAGRALGRAIAAWRGRPTYLVIGMVEGKDPAHFLAPLAPHAAAMWAVPIPGEHASLPPEAIAASGQRLGLSAAAAASVEAAFAAISRRRPGRVLVTGSLYLAGALLAGNGRASLPR